MAVRGPPAIWGDAGVILVTELSVSSKIPSWENGPSVIVML